MALTKSQIEVIKAYKNSFKRNDFDSFFKQIARRERSAYAEFFYTAGIDLFEYLTNIPDNLFTGCDKIIGVSLPATVKTIGEAAFSGCSNLKNVTMEDSVTSIGESAFSNCSSLSNVKLSNSLDSIPKGCFAGDVSLSEIFLPDSVIQLRLGAFADCPDITIRTNYRSDSSKRLKIKQSELDFYKKHIKFTHPQPAAVSESLKENRSLKEAFSDTMPDWLRARLLYTKPGGGNAPNRRMKLANGRYKDYADQPGVNFTSKKRSDQDYFDLWKAMSRKGIDISNAKFIHDGFPRPKKDPRLEEPNIAFFYLDDGSVYGTGLNDNEIFVPEDRAFKAINLKTLMSHIKDFCWLDGSDPQNFMGARREQRSKMNQELKNIPDYNRYKQLSDAGYSVWSGYSLDKSGYLVNPNKFAAKLKELGKKNLAKNLENLYYEIKSLQKQISQVMADYDFRTGKDTSDYNKAFTFDRYGDSLWKDLTRIMEYYNNACDYADRAAASQEPGRRDMFSGYASDYIQTIKNWIRDLKKKGADIFDIDVDWDTNESLKEDIENLEDVDVIMDPVMQDAKEQSERVSKLIDTELEKIEKDLPEWDSERVIGAKDQPVPDRIKEPKLTLDENLFR